MQHIMDLYQNLNNSVNAEECFYRYMNYVGQFGLDAGMLVTGHLGIQEDIDENISYISTYKPSFMRDYIGAGGVKNDLSALLLSNVTDDEIKYNLVDGAPNVLDILGREVSQKEQLIEEMCSDYGLDYGFAVCLDSRAGRAVRGMGLYATDMKHHEYVNEILVHEDKIQQANYLLGLSIKYFDHQKDIQDNQSTLRLTQRQYDLLRWLADGYRLQEIADDKIYRSIYTVNKDLQVLKAIMQVSSHEELVAKGIILGLVD